MTACQPETAASVGSAAAAQPRRGPHRGGASGLAKGCLETVGCGCGLGQRIRAVRVAAPHRIAQGLPGRHGPCGCVREHPRRLGIARCPTARVARHAAKEVWCLEGIIREGAVIGRARTVAQIDGLGHHGFPRREIRRCDGPIRPPPAKGQHGVDRLCDACNPGFHHLNKAIDREGPDSVEHLRQRAPDGLHRKKRALEGVERVVGPAGHGLRRCLQSVVNTGLCIRPAAFHARPSGGRTEGYPVPDLDGRVF